MDYMEYKKSQGSVYGSAATQPLYTVTLLFGDGSKLERVVPNIHMALKWVEHFAQKRNPARKQFNYLVTLKRGL